ncbi:hypothetical protein CEP54_001369 [Fusarium duplospermum]|uniref:Uncharacterized protein n=1 Tax=Fusarium duplospermum TaxID=1325734 RepID=A0A428R1U2_9HYPO|nr:hypothetical protein CEP54_001369 [Fusarium duplospermum]
MEKYPIRALPCLALARLGLRDDESKDSNETIWILAPPPGSPRRKRKSILGGRMAPAETTQPTESKGQSRSQQKDNVSGYWSKKAGGVLYVAA